MRAPRTAGLVLVALALAAGACGETAPRLEARLANAAVERGSHRFAVAVLVARVAHPTGLATFPDGGAPREVAARAEIWRCDAAAGTAERVLVIERPKHMRWGFQPWIAGWSRDAIVAQVTGHPTAESSPGSLRLQLWRVDATGRAEALQAKPDDTVLESRPPVDGRRPRTAPGVHVSMGRDTIAVRTERDAEFRPAFALDPARGELRALPRPARARP